jgi:hypothetical protein
LEQVGQDDLEGTRESIDLYITIRAAIAGIVVSLSDINALRTERHRGAAEFWELIDAVEARLRE